MSHEASDKPDRLIYMANQIGKFFAHQGPEKASAGIAEHIAKFWDPRMRRTIIAYAKDGGGSLEPAVLQAVKSLQEVTAQD